MLFIIFRKLFYESKHELEDEINLNLFLLLTDYEFPA